MDFNEITETNKHNINYEEAMDMLLKSMEKSEVFQLRQHITKIVMGVGAVLFAIDMFLMGYVVSLVDNTASIKADVTTLQQLAIQDTQPPVVEPIPPEEPKELESSAIDNKEIITIAQEYYVVMNDLMDRQECTEEWYLEYKALIDEYADIIGSPDDLTQVYSQDELNLLYSCIETETRGASFASKVNVANVIFNRLNNPDKWGSDLTTVIASPGQFAYHNVLVADDTKLAAEYAYQFEDTTQGAEFFNSGKPNPSSPTYLFTDEAGHSFYSGEKTKTNYSTTENEIEKVDDNSDKDGVG